jgi:redox-sensitive bicupin YhaK (pirin superfamily)
LFPSPLQGPWLPFLRLADTITNGGGDDPEGHTHEEEEVLNYIVNGEVDYEDDARHRDHLVAGTLELLTAREETHHKLIGPPGVADTRWLSVVVRCPRTEAGPAHRFQIARCPAPIGTGDGAVERFLVGPDAPLQSAVGLECVDIGFRQEGSCVCPLSSERRAVAYMFEGSGTVAGQRLEVGVGLLMEHATTVAVHASAGSRLLLASMPQKPI